MDFKILKAALEKIKFGFMELTIKIDLTGTSITDGTTPTET
jgi:hypothetical protein